MGCFGDMETTAQSTSSSTTSPPSWVETAGQQNYNQARSILDQGYQPYGGDRVAPLSSDEIAAGNLVRNKAATGNPYQAEAAGSLQNYGSAPGYQFDWNSVIDEKGPLGSIQNYINPFLQQVLDPTLRQIGIEGAQQRQGIDRSATMSGAFGDARHGVVESEQLKNQGQLVGDTTGKAWAEAFANAMGMRTQDLARLFSTQQAQAGEDKSALDRSRTSAIDLTNLDKYGVSRDMGLASALGQVGANERAITQTGMDRDFEEHLRATGWQDNQIAFLTQILGGTPTSKTTTGEQTIQQPNNTGWQALGALGGALTGPLASALGMGAAGGGAAAAAGMGTAASSASLLASLGPLAMI